ncbi:MAG: inorganic triphosphatase [Methylophagaceae bacterium]
MGLEQELKLRVSGEGKLDLSSLVWLRELTNGKVETQHLSNTYFDTPNKDLRKQGVGLRLRQQDDVFLQTVKTAGIARDGLHQRDEWEHELQAADWDLAKLRQTPLADLINDSNIWSNMQPIFTTNFTREIRWLTLPENTKVELAYDRGAVTAGDLVDTIHEIELEIKQGSIEQLKQFATLMCSHLAVKPSNSSKAKQGYRLVESL